MNGVSIIIVTYNQAGIIKDFLENIFHVFVGVGAMPELIVVDDASSDATIMQIRQVGSTINVVRHPSRRGYGAAIKSGMRVATEDHVCVLDPAGGYRKEDIFSLIREARGHAMVVGSRVGKMPFSPGIRIVEKIMSLVFRTGVRDIDSRIRIVNRNTTLKYVPFLPDGYMFYTAFTLALLLTRYYIKYIPVDYYMKRKIPLVESIFSPITIIPSFIRILWVYYVVKP